MFHPPVPRCWRLALATVLLFLLGADTPEDSLRKGNAAYLRGDYQAALELYQRAEDRTLDPGQVAFNKAAALYQLGDFSGAAHHYRLCLEDASGVRRVGALYGRANSLVQMGQAAQGKQAVAWLTLALEHYQECLDSLTVLEASELAACESTLADARHNLQVATRLLVKKKAEQAALEAEMPLPNEFPAAPSIVPPDEMESMPRRDRFRDRDGSTTADQPNFDSGESSPGKGNLSPLLDDVGAPALDPALAAEYLQATMQRIRQDRATRQPSRPLNQARVRDW